MALDWLCGKLMKVTLLTISPRSIITKIKMMNIMRKFDLCWCPNTRISRTIIDVEERNDQTFHSPTRPSLIPVEFTNVSFKKPIIVLSTIEDPLFIW